jgi:hypothetical protein
MLHRYSEDTMLEMQWWIIFDGIEAQIVQIRSLHSGETAKW